MRRTKHSLLGLVAVPLVVTCCIVALPLAGGKLNGNGRSVTTTNKDSRTKWYRLDCPALTTWNLPHASDQPPEQPSARLSELAHALTKETQSDYERAVAIYNWIGDNVEYDYAAFYGTGPRAVVEPDAVV